MKTIDITMKIGAVQTLRFFNDEVGQQAYLAITAAMEAYKPFKNDAQELVRFQCEDGEGALVVEHVSAATITAPMSEAHIRAMFEVERQIRAVREEVMPTVPIANPTKEPS